MGTIDDPLPASFTHRMLCYHRTGMTHDDLAGLHHDLNAFADQPPGHRVAVRVEVDRAVRLDPAHQIPQLTERRPSHGVKAEHAFHNQHGSHHRVYHHPNLLVYT